MGTKKCISRWIQRGLKNFPFLNETTKVEALIVNQVSMAIFKIQKNFASLMILLHQMPRFRFITVLNLDVLSRYNSCY